MRGNNRFGNSDQLPLLIENSQASRLPIARIEFRGRALRGYRVPRLNLCQRKIEFRAVPHAFFHDGQHRCARQFRQQILEANHAIGEPPFPRVLLQFSQRSRTIEREFAHRRASNFRQVRSRAVKLSQIVRQRTNVRSGTALHAEPRHGALNSRQPEFENLYADRFQIYRLVFPRKFVRWPSMNFLRRK